MAVTSTCLPCQPYRDIVDEFKLEVSLRAMGAVWSLLVQPSLTSLISSPPLMWMTLHLQCQVDNLVSSSGTVNLCSTTDVSSVSSRWGIVPIQADSMLDGQSPFASSAGGRSQSHPDSSLQSNSSLPSLANVSSTTTVMTLCCGQTVLFLLKWVLVISLRTPM